MSLVLGRTSPCAPKVACVGQSAHHVSLVVVLLAGIAILRCYTRMGTSNEENGVTCSCVDVVRTLVAGFERGCRKSFVAGISRSNW
jgi:hypothetical protein